MKNKTKTYILLIAVVSIWGFIGYKVIMGLNPKETINLPLSQNVTFNPKTNITVDTFSVATVNRDPFLGELLTKKKSFKKPIKKTHKVVQWPPIIYNGIVGKENSNDKICIVSINGQQLFFKKNQELKGVKLIKANAKEIVVTYKGDRKTIVKQ